MALVTLPAFLTFRGGAGDRLKTWFINFRRGGRFLQVLAAFIVCYMAARYVWRFDPDFGVLNLILSMEASVATCLLLDMSMKQSEADRALMRDIKETVEEEGEDIEEIAEHLGIDEEN